MKILLLGSRGFLGQELLKVFPEAETPQLDIADAVQVSAVFDRILGIQEGKKEVVVINAAGRTGRPNVDWCEDHKEETLRSNVLGPIVLLEECRKRSLYLVHLSTGCIYEGCKGQGFTEEDPPNFFGSFYSRTKGWSDQILKEFPHFPGGGGVLQLRLRMPFAPVPHERNLITKLTHYARVLDCENSLTYVPDFLHVARILIERGARGTFNVVNPASISPFRIMELYRELVDPSHAFTRLTVEELPTAVRAGRSNCILSTAKLLAEGIILPPVEERVREALLAMRAAKRVQGTYVTA